MPISSISPKDGGFFIRNTVAVIRDAPHPEMAQKLFEYLTSNETLASLKAAGAVEGDAPDPALAGKPVNWLRLLESQDAAVNELKGVFLR